MTRIRDDQTSPSARPSDRATPPRSGGTLRSLPPVHRLATTLEGIDLPRPLLIDCIRSHLDHLRTHLPPGQEPPTEPDILAAIRAQLEQLRSRRIRPVINATGIIIHTNLGRSPLSRAARRALLQAANNYTNLEYDLPTGERGTRAAYVEHALALLCQAEAATVVNNCAAALLLALHHFAGRPPRNHVIVSRGELVQIGGGFRVPEILQASGATLREVGTTNKTSLDDYRTAIDAHTAMILRVHRSNFYMGGFVEDPAIAELATLSGEAEIPFMVDLGSGATFDTTALGGAEREPTPADALAGGADLVCFSGDKLLGGPQAGILAGRSPMIAALKKQPMFRALRCDKLVLSALGATVDDLLAGRENELPIRAMASADLKSLQSRAEKIIADLGPGFSATVGRGEARIGGGSLPRTTIPSITVDIAARDPQTLAGRLRNCDPPVIGYVAGGAVRLDLRTVFPHQDAHLISAVRSALAQP